MKELGIYIHIPFCKQKCYYCDFISYANKGEKINEYINALKKEIKYRKEDVNISTVYIGGGTPSFVSEKYIEEIINTIKENYNVNKEAEITIEVNPGTVDKEKLEMYKKVGINRLSIGLQSTNDRLLKQIGRIHNYEHFLDTYNLAREVGFNNINIDLMLGLPNQSMEDLEDSIENVIKLNSEHISVYSLIVEEETPIEKMISEGELELPKDEIERKMYWMVKEKLEEAGYIHYEISNFAKAGYKSKHNWNCWEQEEYLGFGLASHSYFNRKRYSNTNNIEEYINNIENNKMEDNLILHENQNKEEQAKEYMMLGLRKIEGVSIQKYKNKFIDNPIFKFHTELEKLVNEGLIEIDGDYIKLTNKGLDLANLVWEEFV